MSSFWRAVVVMTLVTCVAMMLALPVAAAGSGSTAPQRFGGPYADPNGCLRGPYADPNGAKWQRGPYADPNGAKWLGGPYADPNGSR